MRFNQEEFNNFVIDNNIIGFFDEPVKLSSGRISRWYINWRKPTYDPFLIEKIANFIIAFSQDINLNVDCFYGIPDGATKLGVITQYLLAKQSSDFTKNSFALPMGRKIQKEYGLPNDRFFIGAPKGRVVVIEDVTTTGNSLLKELKKLQKSGVNVVAALSLTNRMAKRDSGESVKSAVEYLDIPFYNLSDALVLLPKLIEKDVPSENVIEEIKKEFEEYGISKLELKNISKTLPLDLSEKEKKSREKICLALDGMNTLEEVKKTVEELSPIVGMFKIGKESYTKFGPEIVKLVQSYGSKVFLDLKFHDIPNTVKGASKVAAELGVYMFNVHIFGGEEMLKAAVEGAMEGAILTGNQMPKVIGVTVLTSIDKNIMNNELRIPGEVHEQGLHLAKLAQKSGLDGIVCSATDLKFIKNQLPQDFIYVTPGIQEPNTSAGEDQKRISTPSNAVRDGSTILVIGRVITASENRVQTGLKILRDIS